MPSAFFGGADHHGLYADPAFQSLLLRLLLRPAPGPRLRSSPPEGEAGLSEETRLANELRAVMDTLRQRDQQYRLLAEQAADGVLLVAADGRVADASPGAAVLLAPPARALAQAVARASWSRPTRPSTTWPACWPCRRGGA